MISDELIDTKIEKMQTVLDLDETVILFYLKWKPHNVIGNIKFEDLFDEDGKLSEQGKRLPALIGLVDSITGRDRYKRIPEQHQFMYLVGHSEGDKFKKEFNINSEDLCPYDA